MKLSQNTKATLWSIIEKYDGIKEYENLCDSISNIIQDKKISGDLLIIYSYLIRIEESDKIKINQTIGSRIDSLLFSI
jgi:hypothetical protein